jgi:hypothetical protein
VAEPELEPEPVEQQFFAGAGAKVFFGPTPAPEPGMLILIKCYKNPKKTLVYKHSAP